MLLESIVVDRSLEKGFELLHFRYDSRVSERLTKSRMSSGFIETIQPEEKIKKLCHSCELFQKECQNQVFMVIKVKTRSSQLKSQMQNYPILERVVFPERLT